MGKLFINELHKTTNLLIFGSHLRRGGGVEEDGKIVKSI